MRNLLVPVDLSEISAAVVDQAACFAQSSPVHLWLLHVIPPAQGAVPFNVDRTLLRKEAADELRDRRHRLQEYAESLHRDHIQVTTRFIQGPVNTTILAEARRVNADLIIMGSHGHGNIYHALFGGASQKVSRKAPCPVMLIPRTNNGHDWRVLKQEMPLSRETSTPEDTR